MKKKRTNKKNMVKNKHLDLIALIISCVAIFVSLITFILPYSRTRLVIEEPSNIYILKNNEKYDEIIFPIICNNYGNSNRNIYDIECYLSIDNKYVPMKPTYIVEDVYQNKMDMKKRYYSSFCIGQNEIVEKKVIFSFDDENFSKPELIPEEMSIQYNNLYRFFIRFYTTRNSFFNPIKEIIQCNYFFEMDERFQNADCIPAKILAMKLESKDVFPIKEEKERTHRN